MGGQSVLVRRYVYLLRPDQDGHLTRGARDGRGRVERQGAEQDHGGLDGQRAGQRDPLLLAAGELMRVASAESAESDRLEQGVDLATAALASREPEADVARHGQVREQAAFLRDVADPAPLRREVGAGAVDQDAADAIVPVSARSNPVSSRSSVVLPLPDRPRMAVRDPAGTSRSKPARTACAPKVLPRPWPGSASRSG